jgi:hypothetical protein
MKGIIRHKIFRKWGKGKILAEVGGVDRPGKVLVHFESYPQEAAIWIPKADIYQEITFDKFLKSFMRYLDGKT